MAVKYSQLQKIERDRAVSVEKDPAFLCALQQGLLLALHEQGLLNDPQLRRAVEKLRQWSKRR